MTITKSKLFKPFHLLILTFAFTGMMIFISCDDEDPVAPEDPEVMDIIISPDSAEVAVGEKVDFSAVALSATGDTIEDANLTWISSDPDIFTVQENGTITGHSAGTAFCGIDIADNTSANKMAKFVPIGMDSAFVRVLF